MWETLKCMAISKLYDSKLKEISNKACSVKLRVPLKYSYQLAKSNLSISYQSFESLAAAHMWTENPAKINK